MSLRACFGVIQNCRVSHPCCVVPAAVPAADVKVARHAITMPVIRRMNVPIAAIAQARSRRSRESFIRAWTGRCQPPCDHGN